MTVLSMRFNKAAADPGCNLLVGQCSTEMLLDVGLQHCVEVLELSVSDQTNDVYLEDTRKKKRHRYLRFISQSRPQGSGMICQRTLSQLHILIGRPLLIILLLITHLI